MQNLREMPLWSKFTANTSNEQNNPYSQIQDIAVMTPTLKDSIQFSSDFASTINLQ